ncbi:hypothetical protein TWF481_004815 [Arthrobotrys musiformis]|uniref:Uncharacterized protein n=1 Tax=Arthrobotrys musiformis TaxID=47236 RepID=A0AAV9WKN0_9PEZI
MNAIELQIAHGATPVPFMVPLKKALNRQTLEDIIRRRTNCGSDATITMYARTMVIIDWDDWEELVEPGKRYLADIDDAWILHSRGKGHGTGGDSIRRFWEEVEKGKTPEMLSRATSARTVFGGIPKKVDFGAPKKVDSIALEKVEARAPETVDAIAIAREKVDVTTTEKVGISTAERFDTSALENVNATTKKETIPTPVRPHESQKDVAKDPESPKGGVQASQPPRPHKGLNPNCKPFTPSGPVGMGHGIVNPIIEKEVMEALQQQIGILATDKPVRQPGGGHTTTPVSIVSTPPESFELHDDVIGGVKLESAASTPRVQDKVIQKLSSGPPQAIRLDGFSVPKPAPASIEGGLAQTPRSPKTPSKDVPSPQALKSTPCKTPTAKPSLANPDLIQLSSIESTPTAKTITKPIPFQPISDETVPFGSSLADLIPDRQVKSDLEEGFSNIEDSRPESAVGSPPEIVEDSAPPYETDGFSSDDEYEEGDDAYETIDVPDSSRSVPEIVPFKATDSGSNSSSRSQIASFDKDTAQELRDDKRQELLQDGNRITFYLIKPQNRDKPIIVDGTGRIFLSTSKECCPFRLVQMLGKNPAYTRLLILTPADDLSRYLTTDIINPGSRFAQTPFSAVGFEDDITMSWEHIPNDQEEEIMHPACPWDQPDPEADDEEEEYDSEYEDAEDDGNEDEDAPSISVRSFP